MTVAGFEPSFLFPFVNETRTHNWYRHLVQLFGQSLTLYCSSRRNYVVATRDGFKARYVKYDVVLLIETIHSINVHLHASFFAGIVRAFQRNDQAPGCLTDRVHVKVYEKAIVNIEDEH